MAGVTVVLPTFNERETIGKTVDEVHRTLRGMDHEILIVDDDSPDGTYDFVAKDPRVRAVRRTNERGLATAVIRGLQEARGEHVVVMDADGQHPVETIPRLLAAAQGSGASLVVASRHAPGGSDDAFTGTRRTVSHGAIFAARALLQSVRERDVRDPVSGFFLVRRSALPDLSGLKPRGYKILLELLVAMHDHSVVEVPFQFKPREKGDSKLKPRVFFQFVAHLMGLAATDAGNRRLLSFLAVGLSGVLVNLLPLALADWLWPGLGLAATLAVSLAAREAAVLWNFALNDALTFRDLRHARPMRARLLRWHVVTAVATCAYFVVFTALAAAGAGTLWAGAAGIAVGVALNWTGAKRWTYA